MMRSDYRQEERHRSDLKPRPVAALAKDFLCGPGRRGSAWFPRARAGNPHKAEVAWGRRWLLGMCAWRNNRRNNTLPAKFARNAFARGAAPSLGRTRSDVLCRTCELNLRRRSQYGLRTAMRQCRRLSRFMIDLMSATNLHGVSFSRLQRKSGIRLLDGGLRRRSGDRSSTANDGKLARTDWNLSPKDEWRWVGPSNNTALQSQQLL